MLVETITGTVGRIASIDILAGAGWDLGSFLTNSKSTLTTWFGAAIMILGIVAIAYATWQIVSGLMSHGKKQTNWAVAIMLLIVGGALSMTTGFQFMQEIASGGQKTIKDLGGGTITSFYYMKSFLPW